MGKVRRPFNVTAVVTHRTTRLKCHVRYRIPVSSLLHYIYFLKSSSQFSIPILLIALHFSFLPVFVPHFYFISLINPLNAELNPICHLLALLVHFLHVSMIRVKSLTLRLLMSYIYGAPILDVSRSHTTTHHSR